MSFSVTNWQNDGFNKPVENCSPPSAQGYPSAEQNFQDDFPAFEPPLYFSQLQGGLGWATSVYPSFVFSFLDLLLGSVKQSNSRKNSTSYRGKKSQQPNPTNLEEKSYREHHEEPKMGMGISHKLLYFHAAVTVRTAGRADIVEWTHCTSQSNVTWQVEQLQISQHASGGDINQKANSCVTLITLKLH